VLLHGPNYNKMSGISSLLLQTNGFNHIAGTGVVFKTSYVIVIMKRHLLSIKRVKFAKDRVLGIALKYLSKIPRSCFYVPLY